MTQRCHDNDSPPRSVGGIVAMLALLTRNKGRPVDRWAFARLFKRTASRQLAKRETFSRFGVAVPSPRPYSWLTCRAPKREDAYT